MTEDSTADTFSQQLSKIADVINGMIASEHTVTSCLTLVAPGNNNLICVFVVGGGANLDRQFRTKIDAIVAQSNKAIEVHLIGITNLPLKDDGEIDIRLLLELPIVDQETATSCERQIKIKYPDSQVLVEIIERNFPIGLIHCTDLGMQPHQFIRTEFLANNGQPQGPTNSGDSNGTSEKAVTNDVPLTITKEVTTLPEALLRTANKNNDRGVGYIDENEQWAFQSYLMLNEDAQTILAALQNQGVNAGEKILFQLSDNFNFIPAFWACIIGGIVPVPMANPATYSDASNNAVRNLVNTWSFLGKPTILASKTTINHIARMFQTLGLSGIKTLAIETLRESGRGLEVALHNADPEDLAMLLFTSGSTGHPKGVCYTHRNLIENVASSAAMNHLTESDVSLNWLHLDHVGALVRCCIRDVYIGNTQIHAATQLFLHDPLRWLKWIETYRVTFAWAPNFGLSLLNERLRAATSFNADLNFVRSILSVAEPIVPKVAREFAANLKRFGIGPEKLHAAWGMSETCAAVVFSYNFLSHLPSPDYPFVEVGSPVPGLSIRIVDSDDRIVDEGSVGNVQITGPMVVSSYFADDENTNLAYTNDGWFRTGDLGLLKNGRLTITGREKDTIIINGRNIANHEVEAVVDAVPGVKKAFSAAIGVRERTKKTDQLAVFFSIDPEQTDDQKLLLEHIQARIISEIGIQPAYILSVPQNLIPKSSVGKILRSQLRDSFLKGDFDDDIKRSDLLIGNERTLPNWFLKKTWKRKQALLSERLPDEPGVTLIFQDSLGLAHSLRDRLEAMGHTCLLVRPGKTFYNHNSNEFIIDPGSEDDHRLLIEAVFNNHSAIQRVFHLWAYTSRPEEDTVLVLDNELDIWYLSLAFLAKAFSKQPQSEQVVTIYVCATDAQPASEGDYLCCAKSLALGLVRTIPQEQPFLDWRHLDMQVEDIEQAAGLIMNELATIDRDREVAFRRGVRLIPVLEELPSSEFLAKNQSDIHLQSGGLYLITGGLGEIGLELSQALLEDNNAKLLLVGRSPLPTTHSSSSLPDRISMDSDRFAKTLNRYKVLQTSYPYVEYRAIDICDDRALVAAVKDLESTWQTKLCGVFHLARVTDDRLIYEQTRDGILNTLKPKVQGTIAIGRLLEFRPAAFFVGFSSVSSTLGTYRMGPYASANRFLDNFCINLRNSKGCAARSLAWSIWEEVGTDRNYQMRDLSLKRGLLSLSTDKGIASMFAAMRCQETGIIIGLNPENRFISQFMAGRPKAINELQATITLPESRSDRSKIDKIVIQDRLGHSVPCRLINTEYLRAKRLNSAARLASSSPEFTQLRAELEKKVTTIWEKLLQIDCIEPEDNFFDLGGHSILAAQFVAELNSQTEGRIELSTLFEHPILKDFIDTILIRRTGLNKRPDLQPPSLTQLISLAESYYETFSVVVRRQFPQALERFPIADYIEKIQRLPALASYVQVGSTCGPVMKDLKEKAGDDLEPLYNRLALVHAIKNTLENFYEQGFPEDIEGLFIEWFRGMLDNIERLDADYFRLNNDPFLKDMAVCVGRMIPVGGAWAINVSGLGRRIIFGCGPRQLLTRTFFLLSHIRALKPFYEIHMIPRLADRFTEDEREASYLRIAKMLCVNPEVRGLIGSSWYLDPALKDISPELSYLQDLPENNGARIFPLNPSKGNYGALIGSVRRTQLHEEGKYVPRNGLIVWPRKDILKWARTRVIKKSQR